jgi:hypothetical protein
MTTVYLLALILVCAIVLFLFKEMDERMKKLIFVVLAVAVIVWLLSVLGIWSPGQSIGGGGRRGAVVSRGVNVG